LLTLHGKVCCTAVQSAEKRIACDFPDDTCASAGYGVERARVALAYGLQGAKCAADFDPIGAIEGADLALLLQSWGSCP
jgi:hypothetical protein